VSDDGATGATPLTPERLEAVLQDFRTWLAALPDAGAQTAPAETIDLHTLLGQFLGLRHEVNLQTRAVRAQQEQNTETLRQLMLSLETLRNAQANRPAAPAVAQPVEEAVRPLLKTLIDLHDALSLAAREIQRVRDSVLPLLEDLAAEGPGSPPAPEPAPSFWSRLLRRSRWADQPLLESQWQRTQLVQGASERVHKMLLALATGYTMSLQRLERALQQHGLEAIPTVGGPFDPELMEVLEAVDGSGQSPGEVVEEVRRGYRWNGRVFRFAQVRVARS
jgi:molecular chaperone GrpE